MTFSYLLLLLLAGGLAGFGAGFMGIGGGAVLTPICLLVYPVLGVTGGDLVKVIFGTNMFLVTAFSFSAVIRHHRNNRIDWRTVFLMGPVAIFGSICGSWAASVSNPLFLKKGFAVLLIVSSVLIVVKGSSKPSGAHTERPVLSRMFLPALGFTAGFLGSFLGIGGGVIMVPALILLFALPVTVVAGTSSSIIIFIGIAGTLTYMLVGRGLGLDLPGWSTGYVWWSAAIPLMAGGVPLAMFGAWLNARTRVKILQRVFGAVLLLLALRILLS
jgi:uncharacterized membrane protein YfcA